MKEKWDIYDKYMKKTGKTCIRGEYKLKENEYHLVVHIWIITKQGKILLTQRAETKQTDPLKWECTGGSVLKDEEPIDAALRETEEEIGIKLKKEELKLIKKERRDKNFQDFLFAYYVIKDEGIINKIKFTDGEVKDKKWVSKKKFEEMYNKGEALSNLKYIIEENIDTKYKK